MKIYLFQVLFSDCTEFFHFEAENIKDARKQFSEHMKALDLSGEWALIAVYRQL